MPEPRGDTSHPVQFVPTHAQWRYLRAYLEPTSTGVIRHVAAKANVNWRTVYDWLADDRFRDWFTTETRRLFLHRLPKIWDKCAELAEQGSPEHIKLIGMRTGELIHAGTFDQRVPAAMGVFINVPRPEALTGNDAAPGLPAHLDTHDAELVTPDSDKS